MTTRRSVLAFGAAALTVAGGGMVLGHDRRAVTAVVAKHFPDALGTRAVDAFADDFLALWAQVVEQPFTRTAMGLSWRARDVLGAKTPQSEHFERTLVERFIRSTTYIRASETGEEITYLGLAAPGSRLCENVLSAAWL